MRFTPEQLIDELYGPPKKEGQKRLEDFKKKKIPKPERPRSMEIPENSLGFEEIQDWLKENNLEEKLAGGSFEALVNRQQKFYQKFYGQDFQIDRSKIFVESERLSAIKKALENGSVNYPLLIATPEQLTQEEESQSEAEFFYHKLLEPLKQEGLKIWAETGTDRWTKLTLKEWLKRAIPVELKDFNPQNLETNWQKELTRLIDQKQTPPKAKENSIELIFTDSRPDVPQEQKIVNIEGEEVKNKFSFIEQIKNKVKVLSPAQWITLTSQTYQKDKIYLSRNTWDWLMAILDHRDQKTSSPVSAAGADSGDDEVSLNSADADGSGGDWRWRIAL